MSNILGSTDQMDWFTAVLLRRSIRWMQSENPDKYLGAIEREQAMYNSVFPKFLSAANDNQENDKLAA